MIQSRIPSFRAAATRASASPFLLQLAPVEPLQCGIEANRVERRFAPEESQERVVLFEQGA
jgi:hypothetical protein